MARSLKIVTLQDIARFDSEWKTIRKTLLSRKAKPEAIVNRFRKLFFSSFLLGDSVPNKSGMVQTFQRYARLLYDPFSTGYNGIIVEIEKRTTLYAENDGFVSVGEFLKHGAGKTDYYDSKARKSYEQKTGCGDWLRSEKYDTFDDVIKEYRRKRTLICWDYDFEPESEDMSGKKSVNKHLSKAKKADLQERTKTNKDGSKVTNKQYPIHIHICCPYSKLFDYMETYPAGLKTFFKESVRNNKATLTGVYVWEMQTLKNSKKKIEFLQNCPYNTAVREEEEEDE